MKDGTFVGYDKDGNPVAVATYGQGMDTRATAARFIGKQKLPLVREFEFDDPALQVALDDWLMNVVSE